MKIIESLRIAEDYNVITEHKESDLKKRFAEVVDERNELLDKLIESCLYYEREYEGHGLRARDSWQLNQNIEIIKKIIHKSWDEIKEIRG